MFAPCLKELGFASGIYRDSKLYGVKVPVFSTDKLPNVEVSLGPEMRSTGEVLGVSKDVDIALYKGFLSAGFDLSNRERIVLVSLSDETKEEFLESALLMKEANYTIFATKSTKEFLEKNNIPSYLVKKIEENTAKGEKNILDVIRTHNIDLVINTPQKSSNSQTDGFKIRRSAVESGVGVVTSIDSAKIITKLMCGKYDVKNMDVIDVAGYE